MCDCRRCGAYTGCDNAQCTNDECRACRRADEEAQALGADSELEPIDEDVADDPRRI